MIFELEDIRIYMSKPERFKIDSQKEICFNECEVVTGKTYLYQMLEDLKLTTEYHAIKLFNYKSDNFHKDLMQCRGNFIVIDNGDILLTDTDRKFINFEGSNQYLLFLRNCDGLNLSANSFTILKEEDYKITLEKELIF